VKDQMVSPKKETEIEGMIEGTRIEKMIEEVEETNNMTIEEAQIEEIKRIGRKKEKIKTKIKTKIKMKMEKKTGRKSFQFAAALMI